jgi:hypothetical protein
LRLIPVVRRKKQCRTGTDQHFALIVTADSHSDEGFRPGVQHYVEGIRSAGLAHHSAAVGRYQRDTGDLIVGRGHRDRLIGDCDISKIGINVVYGESDGTGLITVGDVVVCRVNRDILGGIPVEIGESQHRRIHRRFAGITRCQGNHDIIERLRIQHDAESIVTRRLGNLGSAIGFGDAETGGIVVIDGSDDLLLDRFIN